jgi:outer membrane lipoprotein-sorting protein
VAGCAGRAPVSPELPATLPSAERLLAELDARRNAVTSLRSFAEIAYESAEENLGSRHAVIAQRPGRFRLEVLSPFGTVALAVSDGREFAVYARRESKVYRGPATPGSVATYAAVPLEADDVVTILLGAPPYRQAFGSPVISRDEGAHLIRLALPVANGSQEVWFAPDTLVPVKSITPLPNGRSLHLAFDDYQPRGSLTFPHRIDLEAEPDGGAVHVRYSSPSLNAEVPEHLFRFPPRAGVEERRIDQYALPVSGSPR